MAKDIYIIDGIRTPFLKSQNRPGPFSAGDLATAAGKVLLARQPFAAEAIDEVILGCAAPSVDEVNIGRVAALRMGCGKAVPAWTVMRNCASGMQSLDSAMANIQSGRASLVLAGGVDALSRTPLIYNEAMTLWFSKLAAARSLSQRAAVFARLPLAAMFNPVIGIMRGLTDPVCGLLMGQTAENLAHRFGITRAQMDEYAARSHQRVLRSQQNGWLDAPHDGLPAEITPVFDSRGNAYKSDDGVREDSTVQNLAKLRPFFDRKYGKVTAGNSSQITDGGVWLVLADEDAVERHGLKPIGRIIDSHWAGLDPAEMGLGPVHAATPLLKKHGLGLNDLDAWEINEAFAAQVLGCLAAWESDDYCRSELGLPGALGRLDRDKLNIDGGAIALGHPVGASGTRIVLHLLHVLKRMGKGKPGRRGMASICIGGGLGGAMLVETL